MKMKQTVILEIKNIILKIKKTPRRCVSPTESPGKADYRMNCNKINKEEEEDVQERMERKKPT